jgi:nicotinate-nucleotide adenylyltransferase
MKINLILLLLTFLTFASNSLIADESDSQNAKNSRQFLAANKPQTETSLKIGIFFGTFDPPHLDHKKLASDMKKKFGLDVVYFIPRDSETYKSNKQPIEIRNKLIELTLLDDPALRLIPSDIAPKVKGLPYELAAKTISETFSKDKIFFILGDDTLDVMNKYNTKLPEGSQVLVRKRLGNENIVIPKTIDGKPVSILDASSDISSTKIRSTLASGGSPEELSPNVISYIKEKRLYGATPDSKVTRLTTPTQFSLLKSQCSKWFQMIKQTNLTNP